MPARSLQSCSTLCDFMNYSLSGFYVHGIYWVRILPCPPGDLPDPEIKPESHMSPAGRLFTSSTTWEAHKFYMLYKCFYV